jgi:integrase
LAGTFAFPNLLCVSSSGLGWWSLYILAAGGGSLVAGKRRFGRVRRLPSGRYQARYLGPDGKDRPAPGTFASKADAEVWLARKEVEIRDGEWIDPHAGKVTFDVYAARWVRDRMLKPRTDELYRGLLRNHVLPAFGNRPVGEIRQPEVRHWHKKLLTAGPLSSPPFGPVTVAKAYRLLHAIMATAADDGLIRRNPCRIKGAGQEDSPERPVVPVPGLLGLLSRIPVRYRAMLLLATFASLRFGELAALHRGDIDLDRCHVRIARSLVQMNDGELFEDEPKSRAGRRVVSFPREIAPELRWHLDRFVEPGEDSLVFVGPKGGRLRRSNFRDIWIIARDEAGLSGLHLHDLRHTGNTMAAATGASLRELMERMGHSSPRAALIYQHATRERDEAIAAAMGEVFASSRRKGTTKSRSGTRRARRKGKAS